MITVNGKDKVEWRNGMTVTDVFAALGFDYSLIVVIIDGEPISPDNFATRKVPDGAQMQAIHIMHGG